MDFQVGEKVIYPNHGIGVVESIQTRPTPTGKISLYQLRILSNDSRVWVPQQNADGVGLRSVITQADVRTIFGLLSDGTIDQHSNWKGRFKENSDKMVPAAFEVVVEGPHFPLPQEDALLPEKRCSTGQVPSRQRDRRGRGPATIEERVDKALNKTFAPPEVKPVKVRCRSRRRRRRLFDLAS